MLFTITFEARYPLARSDVGIVDDVMGFFWVLNFQREVANFHWAKNSEGVFFGFEKLGMSNPSL